MNEICFNNNSCIHLYVSYTMVVLSRLLKCFYQNLAYEVNGTSTTINYFLLQNFTEIRKPDQSSLKCRTTEF